MTVPTKNTVTNIISGVLAGYGTAAFVCFLVLDQMWVAAAPHSPNAALGLVYPHNEHGSYTYFSHFQTAAHSLMFGTSVPLAMLGALIAPKKNVKGTLRKLGASFTWDQDDPKHLMKITGIFSAILTLFVIKIFGPYIVEALISAGLL